MKKFLSGTLLIYLLSNVPSFSQPVEWLISQPIRYNMNPGMVFQMVESSPNGNVITSRLDTSYIIYDQDVHGQTIIECRDAAANLQWSFNLHDSVAVRHIYADANNDIYVGGFFLGTALLDNSGFIQNNSTQAHSQNNFILKLSSTGNLLWSRNTSIDWPFSNITTAAIDHQNNFWFSISDFFNCGIYKVDATGNLVDSILLQNAKGVSGIAFDNFGSLYICGATSQGNMMIGDTIVSVPETYMMYIARLNSSNQVLWTRLGHDITFQSPQLVTDGLGGVYFGGSLMDSVTWGTVSLVPDQTFQDFFLLRVDSTGNFLWGRNTPASSPIAGRVSVNTSPGKWIDTDASGNVVLLTLLNGSVNWGNGISVQGIMGTEEVHVVSFNNNNQPIWQKTGGGLSNFPTGISVSSANEVYLTAAVYGTCTFDSDSVNMNGTLAAIVLKMNAATVGIEENAVDFIPVYPNPASGLVYLPENWMGKKVNVTDTRGAFAGTFISEGTINTLDLAEGIYLLICDEQVSRLVVVKR